MATYPVTVNAIPATPTVTSNSPVCQGTRHYLVYPYGGRGLVQLDQAERIQFINPVKTPSRFPQPQPTQAGTYSVTVTTNGCAYLIDFNSRNASDENMGLVPRNIVMLTADAYWYPAAHLEADPGPGLMCHFLSARYTARVAGTEIGVIQPGRDFLDLFRRAVHGASPYRSMAFCSRSGSPRAGWIAGWSIPAGPAARRTGIGRRMPIKATRALLNAALDGSLNNVQFRT